MQFTKLASVFSLRSTSLPDEVARIEPHRTPPSVFAATVLAVLVPLLAAGIPLSTATAAVPTTHVVPSELPAGPERRAAYYDDAAEQIVRPGRSPIAVSGLPTDAQLLRVHDGYLAYAERHTDDFETLGYRLDLVRDNGRHRVLTRRAPSPPSGVSEDGRTFVIGPADFRPRAKGHFLRVHRISDGRQVGRTLRTTQLAAVQAISARRVLVAERIRSRSTVTRLLWWTPRTGRTVEIPRSRAPIGAWDEPVGAVSSVRRHVLVLPTGRVVDDRRPRRTLWTLRRTETTAAFSPNARLVLTVSDVLGRTDEREVSTLTVRHSRSGRVTARFKGIFAYAGSDPRFVDRVWETNDAFVVEAYEGIHEEEDNNYAYGSAWVRCRVSTAQCERAERTP
ncbi:hypothetical protein [Nocardioides dongkuii]|uniref:hypothetical protein n=1 Tax=Nocardioides dongkuii TaxID=2760089 RepID=UPI0015FAB1E4|nr:hypothetical protein [Nocardioides dongkuii]